MLTLAPVVDSQARHGVVEARIGELMGSINAATAELVGLIGEVIDEGAWEIAGGIKSVEHWVTWQCGVSHARASSWVSMARRRAELPASTGLFESGRVTEDVMAAVARRAPAERDEEIAEQLPRMLYSQVDRLLRTLPRPAQPADDDLHPDRDRVSFSSDGVRWRMSANLAADEGAIVEQAITTARSKLFFERHPDAEVENRSEVSRADGLVRAAELALQRLDGGDTGRRPGDRFQVWMHLQADELRANWHTGAVLPDTLRRFLLCDADVRAVIYGDDTLYGVWSKLRTVDDKLRSVIEQRDGGCAVPGCEQRRWLHIHHLWHWEDGGPTVSWNLCALCPAHHRLHHRGLLEIRGNPDQEGLRFFDRHGIEITAMPPSPRAGPTPPPEQPYVHPSGAPIAWGDYACKQPHELHPN